MRKLKVEPAPPPSECLFVLEECIINFTYVQSVIRDYDLEGNESGIRITMAGGEVIHSLTPYEFMVDSIAELPSA